MKIFDAHISGSLSVSSSAEISNNLLVSGNLTVVGIISGSISGSSTNADTASFAPKYTLTSSFNTFTSSASGRLTSLESESGSIRTDFNLFTISNNATNTTQNSKLISIEGVTVGGSLNYYDTPRSHKSLETGRVEKGAESNQTFVSSKDRFEYNSFSEWTWKILPSSVKPYDSKDLKKFCTNCGSKIKKDSYKFCPNCGTKI